MKGNRWLKNVFSCLTHAKLHFIDEKKVDFQIYNLKIVQIEPNTKLIFCQLFLFIFLLDPFIPIFTMSVFLAHSHSFPQFMCFSYQYFASLSSCWNCTHLLITCTNFKRVCFYLIKIVFLLNHFRFHLVCHHSLCHHICTLHMHIQRCHIKNQKKKNCPICEQIFSCSLKSQKGNYQILM